MKKKYNALVTGGAGFIGSHMVDYLLKKNFNVIVVDNLSGGRIQNISKHKKNKNFKFKKLDIRNIKSKLKIFKNIDYVFHFAGLGDIVPSIQNPKDYFDVNVIGTMKLIDVFKDAKLKKFVYAASSSCYGIANTPTDENHKIDTKYPYALSKYQGEQIVLHYNKLFNIPSISIRIFNAYGTRSRTSGNYGAVFGVMLKQKLENKPLTIVGNGNQRRDFLYVTDVVEAFYKGAISKYKGEIYNLGAGNPQKIKYLASLIHNKFVYLPSRPGEPLVTWANINKIKSHFKWKPKISFKKGVQNILKDINYWKSAPLWNKSRIKVATKDWFKYMR